MGTIFSVETSTELMWNYKQIELFSQQDAFAAMQAADGHSVFVGQSAAGVLSLVREQSAKGTGWTRTDLSKTLPGTVKTFAGCAGPPDQRDQPCRRHR